MPPAADAAGEDDAKSVLAALKSALEIAASEPEIKTALAGAKKCSFAFAENGDVEVEVDGVSTTVLASELGGDDAAKDKPKPPSPPF